MTSILQFLVNGLMAGGIYALVGIGLIFIFRATSVFNFAVGQMLVVGAFITWACLTWFSLPVWLSILISLVLSAAIGLIIERLVTRPLIGQPTLSTVMALLGLSVLLTGIVAMIFGPSTVAYPVRLLPGNPINIGGVSISVELLWSFVIALFVFGLMEVYIKFTKTGLGMRATAEDHKLAQSTGISVKNIFAVSWVIAALVAALGGILIGGRVGLGVHYTPLMGLKIFPVVIFGGIESIEGCFIAGMIVGILENLAAGLIDPNLMEITPYIVLLVALLFRPYGLFGLKRIERI